MITMSKRDIKNAKKIYRESDKVSSALRERGGMPRNKKLRKILREYYAITDELSEFMFDGSSNIEFKEEDVKRLTRRLKQMERFIRATKRVK